LLAALTASRVLVVPSIVNNNPETRDRGRRSFPTARGWSFARRGGRPRRVGGDALVSRAQRAWSRVPGAAQREAERNGALQTRDRSRHRLRDGPGSAMHHSLRSRCIASGTRDSVGRVRGPIHFSNSPSRSRGAFLRPRLATLLRSPESRGGRSAERRSGACEAPVRPAHDAAGQALARRLASHNAGRSPLGAPPWRF
jgi:hypothetical protein